MDFTKYKLTSKLAPIPKGLARVVNRRFADLKVNQKIVGFVAWDHKSQKYRIWIRIVDPTNENCQWKNVKLSYKGDDDINVAIQWAKDHWQTIHSNPAITIYPT